MRATQFHFNPFGLLFGIGVVLLMIGVIPFTPVAVGILLLINECEVKFTWDLR